MYMYGRMSPARENFPRIEEKMKENFPGIEEKWKKIFRE
jgi:hypothetical protein